MSRWIEDEIREVEWTIVVDGTFLTTVDQRSSYTPSFRRH